MPATIGTVAELPTQPSRVAAGDAKYPHTQYGYQRSYLRGQGTMQNPVAGADGTASEVVQWSAPYSILVVQWFAQRIGALPVLPDFKSSDSNEVFANYVISPAMPTLLPDGQNLLWTVSGNYYYYLLKPVVQTFKNATPPYVAAPVTEQITPANFKKLI